MIREICPTLQLAKIQQIYLKAKYIFYLMHTTTLFFTKSFHDISIFNQKHLLILNNVALHNKIMFHLHNGRDLVLDRYINSLITSIYKTQYFSILLSKNVTYLYIMKRYSI